MHDACLLFLTIDLLFLFDSFIVLSAKSALPEIVTYFTAPRALDAYDMTRKLTCKQVAKRVFTMPNSQIQRNICVDSSPCIIRSDA